MPRGCDSEARPAGAPDPLSYDARPMVGLIILAVVLGGGAYLCIWIARRAGQRVDALGGTATTSCHDLRQLFTGVAGEVGSGALTQIVELQGKAVPLEGKPLTTPLGDQPCVWYRSQVIEHYREYETRGTGRERKRVLADKTRTLSDEKSRSNFLLDDGTATVEIDISDVAIDRPVEILDRMRQEDDDDWTTRIGIELAGGLHISVHDEGTVGFQHKEWAIPVGQQLFVMGEAREEAGQLRIAKPRGNGEFIVSTRAEQEIAKRANRASKAYAVIGVVLAVGAVISLVAAFIV